MAGAKVQSKIFSRFNEALRVGNRVRNKSDLEYL